MKGMKEEWMIGGRRERCNRRMKKKKDRVIQVGKKKREDIKTGTNEGALESEDGPTCSHCSQQTTISSAATSSWGFFSPAVRSSTSAFRDRQGLLPGYKFLFEFIVFVFKTTSY